MLKRILKIVGIVLAVVLVGIGILVGVFAIQGKFKKPNVPPDSLYLQNFFDGYEPALDPSGEFDSANSVLNVTYYATGSDVLTGEKKSNIYYFVVNATPDDVTQKNVTMSVIRGAQLIDFCDYKGTIYPNESLQTTIQIGMPIFFKISDDFDDPSAENYEARGEVYIEFTCKAMRNADLTIKIDRQTSDVSLYSEDNVQSSGMFERELELKKYSFETEPEDLASYLYFNEETNAWEQIGIDFVFDSELSYGKYVRKDLVIEMEASETTLYPLTPVFAPAHSNEPISGKVKACDIFIKNGYVYENVKDTNASWIVQEDGVYYFKPIESSEYEFYVVTYPTFKAQEDFEKYFDIENNEHIISTNPYSVHSRVVFKVTNSGVNKVTFNTGNVVLNVKADLFEENNWAVKNSSIQDGYDLDITMWNGANFVTTRYEQIKFLSAEDFLEGNISLVSGNKRIRINSTSLEVSGFKDESGKDLMNGEEPLNGTFSFVDSGGAVDGAVEMDNKTLTISIKNRYDIKFKYSYTKTIKNDTYMYLTFDSVDVDSSDETLDEGWKIDASTTSENMSTIIIAKKTVDEEKFTFGTLDKGSYLIIMKNNEFVNEYFEISTENFGSDKIFKVKPLKYVDNLELYALVVNEDYLSCTTEQPVNIRIDYDTTDAVVNTKTDKNLEVKYVEESEIVLKSNPIKMEDLITINSGTFKLPLMFAKATDVKVKTINQIYFQKDGDLYLLVGDVEEGRILNKVVPLENCIGEQEIYFAFLNYDYSIKSSVELVNSLTQNFDLGENYILEGLPYVGGTIKVKDGEEYNEYTIETIETSTINEDGFVVTTTITYGGGQTVSFNGYKLSTESGEIISIKQNPVVLDIVFVDKLNSSDTENAFGFVGKTYLEEAKIDDEIYEIKEAKTGETNKTISFDITMGNTAYLKKAFLNLIADITEPEANNKVINGLNKNFFINLNIYDYNPETKKVLEDEPSSIIRLKLDENNNVVLDTNSDYEWLAELFINISLEYNSESTQEGEMTSENLQLKFQIDKDESDRFLNSVFAFEFSYGLEHAGIETVCSCFISVLSTAVEEYYFIIDPSEEGKEDIAGEFKKYAIVYTISYESGTGYVLTREICSLDANGNISRDADGKIQGVIATENITGKIEGLIDETLLKEEIIGALPEGYDTAEYEYTVSEDNSDVIVTSKGIDANNDVTNKITIVGLGEAEITLTNVKKPDVKTKFKVVVESDIKLEATGNTVEISDNEHVLYGNVIKVFEYGTFFNDADLMKFRIKNVTTGFTAIEDVNNAWKIVDNSNNEIIYLTYDNKWKLIRNETYALTTLTFDLVAITPIGQEATAKIAFSSPIDIILNGNYDYSATSGLNYYKGTKLKISSSKEEEGKSTLFHLKDTVNDSGQFELQYYSDYNADWIKLKDSSTTFILGGSETDDINLSGFKVGEYRFRIYYNDNKHYEFKVNILDNFIVNIFSEDETQNREDNPYELKWEDVAIDITLDDYFKVYKYETGAVYNAYSDENLIEVDLQYVYEEEDNEDNNVDNAVFSYNEKAINEEVEEVVSLTKIETTGEKTYTLILDLKDSKNANITYENYEFYVSVTSDYQFEFINPLTIIDALKEYIIYTTEDDENPENPYFKLNGTTNYSISAINATAFVDKDMTEKADFVGFDTDNNGNLTIKYNKPSGQDFYIQFKFTIKDSNDNSFVVLDTTNYEISVNSYKLKESNNCYLVGGEQIGFTSLFDMETNKEWGIVSKISVEANDENLTIVQDGADGEKLPDFNESDIEKLKLKADILGEDYYLTFKVTLTYLAGGTFSYDVTVLVKNPYYALIDYKFSGLEIDTTTINLNNASWNIPTNMPYDPALTNEVIDLSKRFTVYENGSTDPLKGIAINSISLVGWTSSLSNYREDYIEIVYINEVPCIKIGSFDAVGYALFKVEGKDSSTGKILASCYYLIRISLESKILITGGNSILQDNDDGVSDREEINVSYTYGTVTDNSLLNILTQTVLLENFDLNVSVLNASNITYTLLGSEGINGSTSPYTDGSPIVFKQYSNMYGDNLKLILRKNPKNPASSENPENPYWIKVAVVVEYQNNVIYLGDFVITVVPNTEINTNNATLNGVKSINATENKLFTYDLVLERGTGETKIELGGTNGIFTNLTIDGISTDLTISSVSAKLLDGWDGSLTLPDDNNNVDPKIYYNNATEVLTISNGVITLNKFAKYDVKFELTLTTGTGLIVILNVTYLAYDNANKVSEYTLGYDSNLANFVYTIDVAELIKGYTATFNNTENDADRNVKLSFTDASSDTYTEVFDTDTNKITFTPQSTSQKIKMVASLLDVVGGATYEFYFTIKPNIEIIYNKGQIASESVETTLDGLNSKLYVSMAQHAKNGHYITTLGTDLTTDIDGNNKIINEIVNIYSTSSNTNVIFSLMSNGQMVVGYYFVGEDNTASSTLPMTLKESVQAITFIPMAESKDFVLRLTIDEDGDGTIDGSEDVNNNGILDEGEDVNNNGILDEGEDVNNNGILDGGEDKDNDGVIDLGEIMYFDTHITLADSYDGEVSYKLLEKTGVNADGKDIFESKNEYQTVAVGSQIVIANMYNDSYSEREWQTVNFKYKTASRMIKFFDKQTNPNQITDLSFISEEGLNLNLLQYEMYYSYGGERVLDVNGRYATIDENNIINFISNDGVNTPVWLRVFNSTGLELWYKFLIEDEETSLNTFDMISSETCPQGKVNGQEYYAITLSDLPTETDVNVAKFKLATLNFSPTEDNFFGLLVDDSPVEFNNSTLTKGSWTSTGITYIYNFENNEMYLYVKYPDGGDSSSYDGLYENFTVQFVNVNGVVKTFDLIVTNITLDYAMTNDEGVVESEIIYANQEGLTLSENASNGNKRLTVKNGATSITYNSSENDTNTTYYIQYLGHSDNGDPTITDLVDANNRSIEGLDDSEYFDDKFDLYGVPDDVTITLNYALYYYDGKNYYKIKYIDYTITIRNDVTLSMNGFAQSGNKWVGDIYLNDYDNVMDGENVVKNEFVIDLIQETSGGKYRNAYITYYNEREGKSILDGELNSEVSNYLLFELKDAGGYTVTLNKDGTFTLIGNKAGQITIIARAKYTMGYSAEGYYMEIVLNIHATVTINQSFGENEIDYGANGYTSNDSVAFINAFNDNESIKAMFSIYKEQTDSNLIVNTTYYKNEKNENKAAEIIGDATTDVINNIEYVIGLTLADAQSQDNWTSIREKVTMKDDDNYYKLTLPYVPYSNNYTPYYVRIKLTATDGREFLCNYQVINSTPITLQDEYTDKLYNTNTVKKSDYFIQGSMLYLFATNDRLLDNKVVPLLKYSSELQDFLNELDNSNWGDDTYPTIKFKNVTDTETNVAENYEFILKRHMVTVEDYNLETEEPEDKIDVIYYTYYIELNENEAWFQNQAQFDIAFCDDGGNELYVMEGFTLTASDRIVPTKSMNLSALFLNSELGDDLKNKKFFAITSGQIATTDFSDYFNGVTIDSIENHGSTKKITRKINGNTDTYFIYKVTITTNSTEDYDYYQLKETFYYIVTAETQFIQFIGEYYISQEVKATDLASGNFTFDLKTYINVFVVSGGEWYCYKYEQGSEGYKWYKYQWGIDDSGNETWVSKNDYETQSVAISEVAGLTGISVTGTTVTVNSQFKQTQTFTITIKLGEECEREVKVRVLYQSAS